MYLDTANTELIKKYILFDWVTGVTTNPTLLKTESTQKRIESIQEILAIIKERQLFVQIAGETVQELIEDAETILALEDDRVALKIAADEDGFKAIQSIKNRYPKVIILATAIFSVEQAYLAGLAGCDWVAPYVNRMENQSLDGIEIISKIAEVYANQRIKTKILGASYKNTSQVINSLLAGADDVTIPTALIEVMMKNKLAADSIQVFNQHAAEKE
ncbi:transaldolase family protein [Carnobacterium pleistocenium]|uniref:transaldolase family protein n=1 Tax=Carnobacterium pleistocenium TaxID=181073 RepID=UPI0005578E85|nr:transaldolase family protein [Carnobacterium pleistocenium]